MPASAAAASGASAAAIVSCLLLLPPPLGSCVPADDASRAKQPESCYYERATAPFEPEVQWATDRGASLRARLSCKRPVHRDLRWRYEVEISGNKTTPSTWSGEHEAVNCRGKINCEINATAGATSIRVCTCMPLKEGNSSTSCSSYLSVTLCPARRARPPRSDAACEVRGGAGGGAELRWRERPPGACVSGARFLVRTARGGAAGGPREWGRWRWLGEASADGGRLDGGVRRCADDTRFLCADLSPDDRHAPVQIGVRRLDGNTPMSLTSRMTCRPSNGASSGSCSLWRAVALSCLAVLAAVAVSSLIIWLWRRRAVARGGEASASPPLAEGRPPLPQPSGSDAPPPTYGDGPPAYTYDYVELSRRWHSPPRPTSPPPARPLHPATEDVRNTLYSVGGSYVDLPRFKS